MQVNHDVVAEFPGAVVERINDVTVGRYDIKVVSGSTLSSIRWARLEMYRE